MKTSSHTVALLGAVMVLIGASAESFFARNGVFQDDPTSCIGRCNRTGIIPDACQCNVQCVNYNDCCPDYYTLCLDQGTPGSCVGKCGNPYNPSDPCHCNTACQSHGNCCPDYTTECGGSQDPITNADLEALGERLFSLERTNPNNVAGYVTWDLQGQTTQSCAADLAPGPLLAVHPTAYTIGTVALLVALHDNYNADVAVPETETATETAEIEAFLDAVLATPIMQELQAFLASKGVNFSREKFNEMWFGIYSRSGSVLGSSGMEHVFLAELKNGVSGFHNWVFFAKEEEAGRLNYTGWMKFLDMGTPGSLIQHNFVWRGACKPITSMFIGTSPEFELAVYSACWLVRPGSTTCPMLFDANAVKVTTYTIGSSSQYVASSYADPVLA